MSEKLHFASISLLRHQTRNSICNFKNYEIFVIRKMSVLLETSRGDIVIDLYVEDCPKTCINFLKLCKCVLYDLTLKTLTSQIAELSIITIACFTTSSRISSSKLVTQTGQVLVVVQSMGKSRLWSIDRGVSVVLG